MSRSSKIIIGALVCSVVVIAGSYITVSRWDTEKGDHNLPAPAFWYPDASGEMVSFEDKVTVLNLWASWSPYSKKELTMLAQLQEEYGDDVSVIALNRDHVPENGRAFLVQENIPSTLTYVYDKNDEYYKKINGYAVPETVVLDEGGSIIFHTHGPVSYEELHKQVASLLSP